MFTSHGQLSVKLPENSNEYSLIVIDDRSILKCFTEQFSTGLSVLTYHFTIDYSTNFFELVSG